MSGHNSRNKVIKFKTPFRNTIYDVLKNRGYKETEGELDWDIHWADVHWMKETFDHIHLDDNQHVNHFRNQYELTRKDLMVKNLKRMKRTLEKEDHREEAKRYTFFPTTFVLPAEYGMFAEEFKRNPGVYIMKPIGKAQGKGIFLFNKMSQVSEWKKDSRFSRTDSPHQETYVVQKYVENPYLVGGKKFDLRIYALVTNYSPLTIYLHKSGFSRFTFHRFSMNLKEIDNNYIHLTNVAIQKTSSEYDEKGCKWNIRQLRLYLQGMHGKEGVDKCFSEIQEIVIRSLISVQKIIMNDKHCFELYGYDILIDSNLRPWLLEVNASPSLTADTKTDYAMKYDVLDDTMTVIDAEKKLTGKEEHIGGFDLIFKNGTIINPMSGPVKNLPTNNYFGYVEQGIPSLLGSYCDREKEIRKMLKQCKKEKRQHNH